jgi:hypothetical protein
MVKQAPGSRGCRPPNPWSLFVRSIAATARAFPSRTRISKKTTFFNLTLLATRWRSLSAEDKQPFVERAAELLAEHRDQAEQAVDGEPESPKLPVPGPVEDGRQPPVVDSLIWTPLQPKSCSPITRVLTWTSGDKLGTGGFGAVFRAIDKATSEIFAVKICEHDKADSLKREHDALINIRHPSVIGIFAYVANGEVAALVMPMAAEGSLHEWLAAGRAESPDVKLALWMQALHGFMHIHGKKLVHCDVKPQNLLIARECGGLLSLRVADFGICEQQGVEAQASCLYTVHYRPYECTSRQNRCVAVLPSMDVWALACVLYELFAVRVGALFEGVWEDASTLAPGWGSFDRLQALAGGRCHRYVTTGFCAQVVLAGLAEPRRRATVRELILMNTEASPASGKDTALLGVLVRPARAIGDRVIRVPAKAQGPGLQGFVQ